MKIIESEASAEYRKDNSVFLAYLVNFADFDNRLNALQAEHKKAVHFVRASRFVNEFSQIVESSSDDGEPKGSSGVPVLNVLRGNDLVDCGIIVVRYFGGKLLGVGGLVRSYTKASLLAVENATLLNYQPIVESSVKLAFNKIEFAKYLCKKLEINIIKFDFMQNFAIIRFKSSKNKIDEFLSLLESI